MKCPYCESLLSKVVDKRFALGKGEIRRRRECLKCGSRFTTYERLAGLLILVIKRDGRKEGYRREKLRNGLLKALEKRPLIDKVPIIVDKIEARIRGKRLREISSVLLGKWVLTELRKLDSVAYIRFVSVYRTFQDPKDFEKEIKNL